MGCNEEYTPIFMERKEEQKRNKKTCQKVLTGENKHDIIIFAAENGGKKMKALYQKKV